MRLNFHDRELASHKDELLSDSFTCYSARSSLLVFATSSPHVYCYIYTHNIIAPFIFDVLGGMHAAE